MLRTYILPAILFLALAVPCAPLLQPSVMAAEDLKAGDIDPETGKKIKYWVAPMDPTYIRNEPGQSPMGMDLVPVFEEEGGAKEPTSTIRIDPVTMQNMGVRLGKVVRKPLVKEIRALGAVTYDESRISTVTTKFDGWIEEMYVDFKGQSVSKGQRLFDIYSPQLVQAQEEFLLALEQANQMENAAYPSIRDNARRMLAAARKRLEYWDLSDRQIRRLEITGEVSKTLSVYSPASGIISVRNAYEGHYVQAGQHQFEIANLNTVWVDVDVYEYELPYVEEGMPATMELSYVPGKEFQGKVIFIYPYLSPETRTGKLRLEFPNNDKSLKPGMYANVYLKSHIADEALMVPQEAVIDSGVRTIAFVARGEGKFEPRELLIGAESQGGMYQVLGGLEEGDRVVLSAQFLLDSESRLREATQKMLEVRSQSQEAEAEELDMSGLDMDSDLTDMDMGDMTIEDDGLDDSDMDMGDMTMDD